MVNCSLWTGVDWVHVSKNLIPSWRAAAATAKNHCSGLPQLNVRDTGTLNAHINTRRHQHASVTGAGAGRPRTAAGAAFSDCFGAGAAGAVFSCTGKSPVSKSAARPTWQQDFECLQNALVWHGHQRRADRALLDRSGRRELLFWITQHAAAQGATVAGGVQVRCDHI